MGRYFDPKTKKEILDTDKAFPLMTDVQIEILLVETQLELDKRTGQETCFRFKSNI